MITGGPYLHMTGLDLEPWELESMEIQELPGCVQAVSYTHLDVYKRQLLAVAIINLAVIYFK